MKSKIHEPNLSSIKHATKAFKLFFYEEATFSLSQVSIACNLNWIQIELMKKIGMQIDVENMLTMMVLKKKKFWKDIDLRHLSIPLYLRIN